MMVKSRREVSVWYVVVAGFSSLALGLLLAFFFIAQSSRSGRESTCLVVQAQIDVYKETPPTTPAGRNSEEAWMGLARTLGCKKV